MYKLCFYVPEDHLETVKAAVFATGAGRIGNYDSCCWQVAGEGQFRPLEGSNPAIGTQHRVEKVREYKVELVCDDDIVKQAVDALKASHPYEEVAFDLFQLVSL